MSGVRVMRGAAFANIGSHLPAIAQAHPHTIAVYAPEGTDKQGRVRHTHLTFKQLDEDSDRIAYGLQKRGIGRGIRTALMVKPSLDFFSVTFALFKAGAVPVLIDPGMGIKNFGRCLNQAKPEGFIGIPKAVLAKRILGWGKDSITKVVQVGGLRFSKKYTSLNNLRLDWFVDHEDHREVDTNVCAPQLAQTTGDEVAAILFTSGSTGPPKGVVYTHSIFEAQVRQLKSIYGIEPGEIDLCTFPLFALFAPALGMTSVIPSMDPTRPARVNSWKLAQTIDDFGVTNMFGSPALLNRVGTDLFDKRQFPSLKRVISAGAPVPATVLLAFKSNLSRDVQIFTPYGATESLPVCSIGSNEILTETRLATDLGKGVCVGKPVEGMRVEIIKISDTAIPNWSDDLILPDMEIGEIAVQGEVVTRSYFERADATALAKIPVSGSEQFFHRMGDLGYRDKQGRIWFCGRKSHRLTTSEGVMFTIPCEGVFNTHQHVYRTALVGVGKPGDQVAVLCVELKPGVSRSLRSNIKNELLEIGSKFAHTKSINKILFHPAFPVDVRHNSKIFREKLAVWAEGRVK